MAAVPQSDADLRLAARRLELVRAGRQYAATHRREFPRDWYDWQREFFAASKTHGDVMLLAGNQVGKTDCSSFQDACDLTGDYPKDWPGEVIEHPINAWLFGVDNGQLKDVFQKALFGDLLDDGTLTGGWIHPDEVIGIVRSQTPGLVKEAKVRHVTGGTSTVSLRAHSQAKTGAESLPFAGSVVDLIHGDEQPPDEIVGQLAVRTINGRRGKGGLTRWTMTPEKGQTNLVRRFMEDRQPHQALIGPIGWDRAPHLTPEVRARILANIPAHERDMRMKGTPFFGSGLVFTTPEEKLACDPFLVESRPWYRVLRAIDLGIDHPTAIVWLAYDPEQDVIYLTRVYRQSNQILAVNALAGNTMWPHAPMVFPHDADQRNPGSGEAYKVEYQKAGIANGVDFANPDGSNYVEVGITILNDRMQTGRFRVFRDCVEFFDEYRKYHRKNGQIVKLDDDVISATRYGAVMVATRGVPVSPAPLNIGPLAPKWRL